MSAEAAVRTRGLTKRYGAQLAVADLDLEVPTGAVYGFLGPNGSGKTTTIRMLLGLVDPTAGEASVLGVPVPSRATAVLPRVGALVEGPAFHGHLSGRANLLRVDAADATTRRATARSRADAALERVGLAPAAGKRYRAYSLGMRQRLGLAAALLRPRDLLVLDEPTNGLDPQGTREVRALVREVAAAGTTVLVSTHLLTEVEQLCSHVGVMSAGRMVAAGTLADVVAGTAPRVRALARDPAGAAAALAAAGLADVRSDDVGADAVLGDADPEAVLAALVTAGAGVREFTVRRPALEDRFVSLTGEGFDVSG